MAHVRGKRVMMQTYVEKTQGGGGLPTHIVSKFERISTPTAVSRFELKDELIKAIEEEELKGRDLLSLSQKELKEILKKTGRVRRLTEALEQFRL